MEADPAKLSQISTAEAWTGKGGETGDSTGPSGEAPPVRVIRGKLDEETLKKLQSGEPSPVELEALQEGLEEGEAPEAP